MDIGREWATAQDLRPLGCIRLVNVVELKGNDFRSLKGL
jgi:hypothetical protein